MEIPKTHKTPQLQFLSGIDYGGIGNNGIEYQDIYLSDYNHDKVQEMPNISPKRWVLGLDLKLWPGYGSGTIVIAGKYFQVRYAWGGRNKPKGGWGDRTCYTVRLEGNGVRDAINNIRNAIIKDEEGAAKKGITFRQYQAQLGIKSCKAGQKQLKASLSEILKRKPKAGDTEVNKLYASLKRKLAETPIEVRLAKYCQNWKENKTSMVSNRMKRIETDMLP